MRVVSERDVDDNLVGKKNGGVQFLTYSLLAQKPGKKADRSRLEQLIAWCESVGNGDFPDGDIKRKPRGEFDGCIVFDEAHKAKNLVPSAGQKPTATGLAVLELQKRLPKARRLPARPPARPLRRKDIT